MDLTFLRILAAGKLPRTVPPGPAFQQVAAYQASDYVDAHIPPNVRTRSGGHIQPDARVLSITARGQRAIQESQVSSGQYEE